MTNAAGLSRIGLQVPEIHANFIKLPSYCNTMPLHVGEETLELFTHIKSFDWE